MRRTRPGWPVGAFSASGERNGPVASIAVRPRRAMVTPGQGKCTNYVALLAAPKRQGRSLSVTGSGLPAGGGVPSCARPMQGPESAEAAALSSRGTALHLAETSSRRRSGIDRGSWMRAASDGQRADSLG